MRVFTMQSESVVSKTSSNLSSIACEQEHVAQPPPSKRRKTSNAESDIGCTTKTASANDNGESEVMRLEIIEATGDFFDAPQNTLLVHACNCEGSWGAGIAKAFKQKYPKAYKEYANHCDELHHGLIGKAQLILPVDHEKNSKVPKHFIGCLYTSRGKGRRKDSATSILGASKPAMNDLLTKAKAWNEKAACDEDKIKEVRMCKINSGLFAVPWDKTKAALETINGSNYGFVTIEVVSPG
ncbi:Hypothetical protein R9X50_00743200 [Acrodontium crateriforme]|uniref:ADP-ribose 1''-phosphate phosphatase n=1 Tax=Acrodontium crateriforme TaxID=150365 RepID=A0AAQ3MB42_9PEZI|nr:Hypothetical protein R9X50_00743200 [Acrodontium crateriforme]